MIEPQQYRCDFCMEKTGTLYDGEPIVGDIIIKAINDSCICESCVSVCVECIAFYKEPTP